MRREAVTPHVPWVSVSLWAETRGQDKVSPTTSMNEVAVDRCLHTLVLGFSVHACTFPRQPLARLQPPPLHAHLLQKKTCPSRPSFSTTPAPAENFALRRNGRIGSYLSSLVYWARFDSFGPRDSRLIWRKCTRHLLHAVKVGGVEPGQVGNEVVVYPPVISSNQSNAGRSSDGARGRLGDACMPSGDDSSGLATRLSARLLSTLLKNIDPSEACEIPRLPT